MNATHWRCPVCWEMWDVAFNVCQRCLFVFRKTGTLNPDKLRETLLSEHLAQGE